MSGGRRANSLGTMTDVVRNDWTMAEVQALFELPLMDLVRRGVCTSSSTTPTSCT